MASWPSIHPSALTDSVKSRCPGPWRALVTTRSGGPSPAPPVARMPVPGHPGHEGGVPGLLEARNNLNRHHWTRRVTASETPGPRALRLGLKARRNALRARVSRRLSWLRRSALFSSGALPGPRPGQHPLEHGPCSPGPCRAWLTCSAAPSRGG